MIRLSLILAVLSSCFSTAISQQKCLGPLNVTVMGSSTGSPLTSATTSSHIYCTESSDGTISLMVSGGTPAYTCKWSHDTITNDLASGLSAGLYHVTVTDENNCTDEQSVELVLMDPLLDSLELVMMAACGECYMNDATESFFYYEDYYIASILDNENSRDLGNTNVCVDFIEESVISTMDDPALERCWTITSDSIEKADFRLFFSGEEFDRLAVMSGFDEGEELIYTYSLYVRVYPIDTLTGLPREEYYTVPFSDFTITYYDELSDVWSLEMGSMENAKIELRVSNSVLPVDLLSFEGKSFEGYNELYWSVASEVSISEYQIERSQDGIQFTSIGSVDSGRDDYIYLDSNPYIGDNFYRLKIVEEDGAYRYSHIVRLVQEAQYMFTVVNNPVHSDLILDFESRTDTDVLLSIFAIDGKLVWSDTRKVEKGTRRMYIDMGHFVSGNYILHSQSVNSKFTVSEKIVKI